MNDILRRYIARDLLGDSSNGALSDDDDLLVEGVDSVGMMSLVMFIEEQWGLAVPPEDVVIENFQSIARIEAYVRGRLRSP